MQQLNGAVPVEKIASKVRADLATRVMQIEIAGNSFDETIELSLRNLARMRLLSC